MNLDIETAKQLINNLRGRDGYDIFKKLSNLGIPSIAEGSFSTIYNINKNYVLKVSSDLSFSDYARFCRYNYHKNSLFPKILRNIKWKCGEGHINVCLMEKVIVPAVNLLDTYISSLPKKDSDLYIDNLDALYTIITRCEFKLTSIYKFLDENNVSYNKYFVSIFNNWAQLTTPYIKKYSIDIHDGNYGWRNNTKTINDLVIFDPVC